MMSFRQLLISLLFLAAWTKPQSTTCLSFKHQRRLQLTGFAHPRILYGCNTRSSKSSTVNMNTRIHDLRSHYHLRSKKIDSDDYDNNDNRILMDPGLWISDFFALIIASQLIGLLDVVNNPEFIENGGWFQPIPAVPSTLDDLIQRISSFGILWALSSASVILLAKTTATIIRDATTTLMKQNTSTNSSDRNQISKSILDRNIQTLVLFGVFQILLNGIMYGFDNAAAAADNLTNQNGVAWLDVLRNCYYVGLFTSGSRYIYGRYFQP